LEKEEVADLVSYIRKFNIEVIPELPSLTHAYYLLWGHKELAENMAQPYPDTYCPLKPGSYDLYFDVLDEYLDVIKPKLVHVGHDEWRMEKDLCELCKGKDYGELYAMDITKIHDHLAKRGIRTAIWGDHLLESVTEHEFQTWKSSAGYQYKIPGALRPEQVLKLIPKDILIFNWFWDNPANDRQVSDFGFEQVYGNFRADIKDWQSRADIKGLLGGAPSSWAATTEKNFGKDQLTDFLGASNLLWSHTYIPPEMLVYTVESLAGDVYYHFRGKKLPSETGDCVTTTREFSPPVNNIQVNSDPNSIIFLHACEQEAANRKAYSIIHNFDETSELLGWYEIVYQDGYIETVPLRYGLNILDRGWRQRIGLMSPPKAKASQNQYAYQARAVRFENDGTFFSYEWLNPRPGIMIKEINVKQKAGGNPILLRSVSFTEKKRAEEAKGTERY
ncbi:MAG TPA: family 20 glycosylhydrolase, partial [Bacteroidales bacterium]|nr:family 20 glycosylhydrolase [Bacteroidales bacterium]